MKILIYIEPHPIRNSLTHFKDVAKRFVPLLANNRECEIRMYANRPTLDTFDKDTLNSLKGCVIWPTEIEDAYHKSQAISWENEGICNWKALMEGVPHTTEPYLTTLHRIWNLFPFEMIVNWGENGAVTKFSSMYNVTKLSMELGCTRSPFLETIVADPYGTNGASVIPRLSIDEIRDIVGDPMSKDEALFMYTTSGDLKVYQERVAHMPDDYRRVFTKFSKIAFLPLQLFDDANLIRFSRYESISSVVEDVIPRLCNRGYFVVAKFHPGSKHRLGANVANSIAKGMVKDYSDNILWVTADDQISNAQLINHSDLVVTVNSSVGFEALYLNKTVAVLGEAVYKPIGVFPTLNAILEDAFSENDYLHNIGYLRRFMLGGYLHRSNILKYRSTFLEECKLIHGLHCREDSTPLAYAERYWSSHSISTRSHARSVFLYNFSEGDQKFVITEPDRKVSVQSRDSAIPFTDSNRHLAYMPIVRRLVIHSGSHNYEEFLDWLTSSWATESARADITVHGGFVDVDFYNEHNPDVKNARVDAIYHFSLRGFEELRQPSAKLKPASAEDTFALLLSAAKSHYEGLQLHSYPLETEESYHRADCISNIERLCATSKSKILVVAHIFYNHLVEDVLQYLAHIPEQFDLIVTMPDWGYSRIETNVQAVYPDTIFYKTPNRGRDIGPFSDILHLILDAQYDCVLKIQTKQGYYHAGRFLRHFGDLWREEAFQSLLGSTERVSSILNTFRSDPTVGMLGPGPHLVRHVTYPYHDNGILAEAILGKRDADTFFAGTMFWFRPECLSPLKCLRLEHYEPENGANDGALAHLVERLFGQSVTCSDFKILAASPDQSSPLIYSPLPTSLKFYDYFTQRIEQLHQQDLNKSKGALIWR